MNNLLTPVIVGVVSISLLFALCFFLVVGVKITVVQLKKYFTTPAKVQAKVIPPKPKTIKSVKPTKSIEIDADQFDKIYFKKSS